jgi:hypothetical protein
LGLKLIDADDMTILTIIVWLFVNINFFFSGWTFYILFIPYLIPALIHIYASFKLTKQISSSSNNASAYIALIYLNVSYLFAGILTPGATDLGGNYMLFGLIRNASDIFSSAGNKGEWLLFGLTLSPSELWMLVWYGACFLWLVSIITALAAIKK